MNVYRLLVKIMGLVQTLKITIPANAFKAGRAEIVKSVSID